jgi:hypothetical protein
MDQSTTIDFTLPGKSEKEDRQFSNFQQSNSFSKRLGHQGHNQKNEISNKSQNHEFLPVRE